MARVYTSAAEIDFELTNRRAIPRPGRALFVTADFFDVQYVINPHMKGYVGQVNKSEAARQWSRLQGVYESLGFQPGFARGEKGLPDMVFCANQTLPYYLPTDGTRGVVLSRMHAPERRPEVEHVAGYFRAQGYQTKELPADPDLTFEGMGDAIWHPGRYLLWGGYGFRTSPEAYPALSELLGVDVLALRLNDPYFYHLDTCFSVLNKDTVLVYPGAFEPEGLALIGRFFSRILEAPEKEAKEGFACNAHCPDDKNVIIQKGNPVTSAFLREAGFNPIEVDTSEFIKAGGSVFCLKLMFW